MRPLCVRKSVTRVPTKWQQQVYLLPYLVSVLTASNVGESRAEIARSAILMPRYLAPKSALLGTGVSLLATLQFRHYEGVAAYK